MMRPNKRGFALILAVFLLLFISLLFVTLFNLLTTDIQIAGNLKNDARVLYIADAGIEYAIFSLRQNGSMWNVDSEETVFPPGSESKYVVTYPIDSGIIRSVGELSDGYSKTIEAKVSVSGSSDPYTVELIRWEEK